MVKVSKATVLIAVLAASATLGGCGEEVSGPIMAQLNQTPAEQDGGEIPREAVGSCNTFDPDKVYVYGSVQTNVPGRDVLLDLRNPSNVCPGFYAYSAAGTIDRDGRYVYSSGNRDTYYAFRSDRFEVEDGNREYPLDPYVNDKELFTHPEGAQPILAISPDVGEMFFLASDGIHSNLTSSEPYAGRFIDGDPNGIDNILSAPPGGSLFVTTKNINGRFFTRKLYRLSADGTAVPIEGLRGAVAAKLHSGNTKLWVVTMEFYSKSFTRWSIDLATNEVVEEGVYAAIADFTPLWTQSDAMVKLDGSGNLWTIGAYGEGRAVGMLSLGTTAGEIVYLSPTFEEYSPNHFSDPNVSPLVDLTAGAKLVTGM